MAEPLKTTIHGQLAYSVASLLVRAASSVVQQMSRHEFVAEWESEIWHELSAQNHSIGRSAAIVRRALGAVPHALWLRKKQPKRRTALMDSIIQDFPLVDIVDRAKIKIQDIERQEKERESQSDSLTNVSDTLYIDN